MEKVRLFSEGSSAEVLTFGGMTTADFMLDGKRFSPFYRNPWKNSVSDPFLAHLQGDFFCLPFGIAPGREIPGWCGFGEPLSKEYSHGYSANGRYEILEQKTDQVTLRLAYDTDEVAYVTRSVKLFADRVAFEDLVMPGKDFDAPVGFHPIFRLPETAGDCRLAAPACSAWMSYPGTVDESSVFAQGETFQDLGEIRLKDGTKIDASALPVLQDTEELLCALNVAEGVFELRYPKEGYAVELRWDASVLPHCLVWLSNRGRKAAPWSGRNLCVGIEPVASAFDMGRQISAGQNPLAEQGYRTCIHFRRGEAQRFVHSVSVRTLENLVGGV